MDNAGNGAADLAFFPNSQDQRSGEGYSEAQPSIDKDESRTDHVQHG